MRIITLQLTVGAVVLAGHPAAASPVLIGPVDYTASVCAAAPCAGAYGAEIRYGIAGAGDWELAVGPGTSNPGGYFNQGQWLWDGSFDAFSFSWDATGASFSIGPGPTTVSWLDAAFTAGNVLVVETKRSAEIQSLTVNGVNFGNLGSLSSTAWPSGILYIYDPAFAGVWNVSGTMNISPYAGTRSASEVFFKTGDFTPVPEPATLLLLGTGLGAVAIRRRAHARKRA